MSAPERRARRLAPTPPGLFPWLKLPGSTGQTTLDRVVGDLVRHGDLLRYRLGPVVVHHLFRPEHIKHVLQDNHTGYIKGPALQKARVFLGNGLITSEGEFWRRQRRLAQPAFHARRLQALTDCMVKRTSRALAAWEGRLSGPAFDLCGEMLRLSLGIAGESLFGDDISGSTEAFVRAVNVVNAEASRRATELFDLPLFVPTPRNLRLREACQTLDRIIYGVIDARAAGSGADRGDLLSMLLAARDEDTGAPMERRQLRDEAISILVAGYETSAMALSWTFALLSAHPEVEARVAAEVEAVLGGRAPTFEELGRLTYTQQVLEESMRLHPPVWGLARYALADDEVGGCFIPKGSIVVILPYGVHRNPALWPDAERFDPDRFAGPTEARPRFAYLPFGGGPRICIGNAFALLEAKVVLALVLQRLRLRVVPGADLTPELLISLRPRHGIPVTLTAA